MTDIFVVNAMTAHGHPARLRLDTLPHLCDHEGYAYSCTLAIHCPECGVRLFLPPRFLARLDATRADEMYRCWVDAGWPEFHTGQWAMRWPIHQHPLFDNVGGIPVNPDRLSEWRDTWV